MTFASLVAAVTATATAITIAIAITNAVGCSRPSPSPSNAVDASPPSISSVVRDASAVVVPAAVDAGATSGCIKVDPNGTGPEGPAVGLDGVVFSGTRGHPNQTSVVHFFGLKLDTPRCVSGLPDVLRVEEVQLLGESDDKQLKPLDGKKVHVEGVAFAEYTAWHVRPVVLSVKSVTRR